MNVFTVNYGLDEAGRMLTREVVGEAPTQLRWDGLDLVGETTGESSTEYLVPGDIIYGFLRNGERFTLNLDATASCRSVTDEAGEVVARREYSAFGQLLEGSFDSVPGGLPFGFVGGAGVRTDATTKLIWMRKRWHEARMERLKSSQPIQHILGRNHRQACAGRIFEPQSQVNVAIAS